MRRGKADAAREVSETFWGLYVCGGDGIVEIAAAGSVEVDLAAMAMTEHGGGEGGGGDGRRGLGGGTVGSAGGGDGGGGDGYGLGDGGLGRGELEGTAVVVMAMVGEGTVKMAAAMAAEMAVARRWR